jgi:hypothetical protein
VGHSRQVVTCHNWQEMVLGSHVSHHADAHAQHSILHVWSMLAANIHAAMLRNGPCSRSLLLQAWGQGGYEFGLLCRKVLLKGDLFVWSALFQAGSVKCMFGV